MEEKTQAKAKVKIKAKIYIDGAQYIGEVETNNINDLKAHIVLKIVEFYQPVNNGRITPAALDAAFILKLSLRTIWKYLKRPITNRRKN